MAILARLGVVLGLDSAEFQQGLASAGKKLEAFANTANTLGKTGALAFAAMAYEAGKLADELSDTAKANDVTIESVLKLQHALMLSGGEAENAGKMLNSFSNFIDKAATGNEDAQKSFAKMGISLKDLANLSAEDLFKRYAEGLSQIDDTATRAAKANDAFGKAAKGVDFRSFNDELEHGTGLTAEYEKSIADAADAWDILQKSHHEFVTNFAGGMGTVLKQTLEYMEQISDKTNIVGEVAKTVFQTIAVLGSNVAFVFKGIADEIMHTIDNAKILATEGVAAAIKFNQEYERSQNANRERLDEYQRRVMGGGGGYGGGASNFQDPRRLDNKPAEAAGAKRVVELSKSAQKIQQMLEMAKLISVEYERHLNFNLQNLKTQGQMIYMTENQKKVQEAINKISDDVDKKLDEIQKKREEAAAHGADKSVLKELDNQAQKVRELGDAYKQLTETEIESQVAAQQSFEYGWSQALKQYQEDAQNAARVAGDMFNSVTSNMSSAIDNFVRTGKFSFKDFARSVIQDLIAIQMKMQAMQMFAGMGGIQGIFSSLTGGQYTPGSNSFVGPMPAAADGGMINGPTLVGENGPEIFIPQSSGTVIPNQRLSSTMNSQPQIVYNGPYIANMSAIDTQSAQQFLTKNKTAVYAANMSASRSIPASR